MEKIIFRKFFYDLFSFFLISTLSLSLIIWIIQSVNFLDLVSKDGHGFKIYFSFVALNFPKIFSSVLIFSYFVSIFYIIQKYQLNNEILIFWTNGISKIKFINFIIKISIIFTIIQISFVYFALPKLQDYSRDFIRTSNIDLFTSLISEKKFIDTVKDFTIFVERIDDEGNFENIYLKDSINKVNTQIIIARSGQLFEDNKSKYLNLNYGQILDLSQNNVDDVKVIKFNSTTFNLSNFKTKTTTFPKIQELNSIILFNCLNNFLFGNKINYNLPVFQCSKDSSIKSGKELFDRSFKQVYIITIGLLASLIIFISTKDTKYLKNKIIIFLIGIIFIIFSEVNSEFINTSVINNIIIILMPILLIIIAYFAACKLAKNFF